ncbi:MAG TPA: alpha-ketoacid dehydrogenase subunit beta [Candidatus Dormibacteraeota bacterium]|jgi:2-oxoisovalerate dehydrogenase E1 component beta subunit|nr:alpha-ketoacid dehydrogenase subunit beta [Candidatus Dormibacteraeota bacterium]
MAERNLVQAIREALHEEMERDSTVCVLGEDVGHKGGVFKATEGLQQRFGPERVLDTPLAESSIAGVAQGLALEGFRPVAEMQFADYSYPAFNQIVNEIARVRYRSNGDFACPLVIRAPTGGGVRGALYHSQSPEAFFCHVPGLKVVLPSTPVDAKGLLKAAIREPDPVIFLEPKKLYRAERQDVPQGEDALLPLGVASVVRPGNQLTAITYGYMRVVTLQAAALLAREDVEVEVIDLRTLRPWDVDSCVRSVQKTGRVAIVYEANRTGGFGAEIAAELAERCFASLDAPVIRIASPDAPAMPFSTSLEHAFMLNPEKVAEGLRRLARY